MMNTTKHDRSIYLDDEIMLFQQTLVNPTFNIYESGNPRRKRGNGIKSCGKAKFRDLEEVKNALFAMKVVRTRKESQGLFSKRQEKRYYFCNRCHSYHVTSKAHRFVLGVSNVQAS